MTRNVVVCGVPHLMQIIEGGVLFSDKSGFCGHVRRIMWEYRGGLWYLVESEARSIPAVHLTKMHKLLCTMIGRDHESFELAFRDVTV